MKHCPKCKSQTFTKNGFNKGNQPYHCSSCGFNFSTNTLHRGYDDHTRRQALKLHTEGVGFRSIERLMNISHNTVANWVRQAGKKNQPANRARSSNPSR